MRVRPSGWWYALPALLFVALLALAGVQGADELRTFDERISSIGANGEGTVQLEAGTEPGVWAEFDGATSESVTALQATVEVTGPDGERIASEDVLGRQTWSGSRGAAIKVAEFEAREQGAYHVVVSNPEGPTRWSIGDLDVGATIWRIGRWLVLGLPLVLALLIAIVLLRHGSKRRARMEAAASVLATQGGRMPMSGGIAPPSGPPHAGGPFS